LQSESRVVTISAASVSFQHLNVAIRVWSVNTRDGIAIAGGSHSLQDLVRTSSHGGPLYETPAARPFLGDIVDVATSPILSL
jgi:hypothetical protein